MHRWSAVGALLSEDAGCLKSVPSQKESKTPVQAWQHPTTTNEPIGPFLTSQSYLLAIADSALPPVILAYDGTNVVSGRNHLVITSRNVSFGIYIWRNFKILYVDAHLQAL